MNKLHLLLAVFLFSFLTIEIEAQEKAQWITAFENQSATNTWLCFRKDINISELPKIAKTRIAVDSKYWLWINGKMVVFEGAVKRGPNPRDTYYDELDIAKYLTKGKNTIAILLWYFGKEGFSHNSSGKAALFFDCSGENGFRLVSNETWKAKVHPAFYTVTQPFPNFRLSESSIGYDARFDIGDWQEIDSKEASIWANAKTCGVEGNAPWFNLHHRVIPLWKDSGLKEYASTEIRNGAETDTLIAYVLYNCQITPYIEIEAEKAGSVITMFTDYYTGGGKYNVRAEYITKKGLQEYESYGWMNGQKVYYIIPKFTNVIKVKYRETAYNTEFAGSFECSDNFLNKYWEKARRTLCVTMRDTYMDCPDRERSQWWGDVVNQSGEAFYALDSNSHLLMKKGMYELIGWQKENGILHSPIPESNFDQELPCQMLASIGYYGFWNYYQNTGDKKPILDLYDGVRKYLKVWTVSEDGSINQRKMLKIWGDWGSNIDKTALINAWYFIGLKGAKLMAENIGKNEDALEYQRQMDKLKNVFNTKFWNGNEYRHPDYTGNTDDRVNALAIVSGIADKDKYPALLEVFKTQEYASPYMEKYVTEALFVMGYGKYGLERMKKRFDFMVNHKDYTTLFEGWGIGKAGFGGGSTNHGWSGGGLTILSQYLCGIAPLEAGYKTFSICPAPSGIKNAKITVASVAGKIISEFVDDVNEFSLYAIVPFNTNAIIGIPIEKYKTIYVNNKLVWKAGKFIPNTIAKETSKIISNKHILFNVKSGNYKILAKKESTK
jgi:alpha-L-rhamnosidase